MEKKMSIFEAKQISSGEFTPFDIYEIPIDELRAQYINYALELPISKYDTYKNVVEETENETLQINEVCDKMQTKFFLKEWQCLARKAWNFVDVALIIPNIGQNDKIIIDEMQQNGYFKGPERTIEREGMVWKQIQFKPYYSKSLKDEIKEDGILYHVTAYNNIDSISRNGIIPSDENMFNGKSDSNRPKLVFLLRGYTGLIQWKKLAIALNNSRPNELKSDRFAVFKIDIQKLPENIDFQGDPEHPSGVCTYSYIPPDALSLMLDFNIKKAP